MEFNIRGVHFKADQWEVTAAIAKQVLHVCPGLFVPGENDRLPNFKVQLNESPAGGVQNDGTGTLTMTKSEGRKFQRLSERDQISIDVRGKKLRFSPSRNNVRPGLTLELEKAPFVDPNIEKDRTSRINTLCDAFHLTHVQIGTFYQQTGAHPRDPRTFSVEWDQDLTEKSMGRLFFEYDYKYLRVQIGDPSQEDTFYNLIVRFSTINKMAIGYDFRHPYVCFDLFTPPIIQKEEIFQEISEGRNKAYQQRVGSVNPGHEAIAPYAHQLRVVLYDSSDYGFSDVLQKFEHYCETSFLHPPKNGVRIEANGRQNFFSRKRLNEIALWLRSPILTSNWRVAFQVAALLHNGVANTVELIELRPRIDTLVRSFGNTLAAGDVMRRFVEAAARRPLGQRVFDCFESVLAQKTRSSRSTPSRGRFFCHHVTFTPTRLLLEGPTITQSNRVIREYEGHEDHFLRVDFRDEDHHPYRWDRDVDVASYLQERVGTLLKSGFDLAGRHFDFLGYSSSALKEHAVWYVNPFQHPEKGWVTAQTIRDSLGDFSKVITSPSKFGARMAQAFTGTDPSVRIGRDQWSEIPDIEDNGINFTDGVGTISLQLAELIWQALCEENPSLLVYCIVPSAYQIRFLGCKGVVSVDPRLEGVHMCVRPSMKKFEVPGEEHGTIEIASHFGKPNIPYLNRPLVMVLEDRGAPKEVFVKLQNETVANTRMAHDSAALFAKLLESNRLCYSYRLEGILKRLNALGLELKPNHLQQPLDTPFLARLRACAINHVLHSVKHEARLPIPDSYMLVGVADEGPAYVRKGQTNVYCLPQGKIFACVQRPGEKPHYLQGMCLITRNPVIHPGDVQRVYAIGPPPGDRECLFGHLKNVVVFPSIGTWSLPNGLAGGDLDGDLYAVIQCGDLLVPEHCDPASYPPVDPFKLDRPSTIDDVCDFIVEYILSDVVGIISNKHITIADQSKLGTRDPSCLQLAQMHSWAVDYPKNGNKVDISDMPRELIRFKPDWDKKEDDSKRRASDYYESNRALGHLYRAIDLENMPDAVTQHKGNVEVHPIFKALEPLVRRQLPRSTDRTPTTGIESLYVTYREELAYIASTFSLTYGPGARLREEELVTGTILTKSSQKRYRKDRIQAMKENMGFLVYDTKEQLVGRFDDLSDDELREKLGVAWDAWKFSLERTTSESFGPESFGLIGLGLVLEFLERLGGLPPL